jgi:hypothetical protein
MPGRATYRAFHIWSYRKPHATIKFGKNSATISGVIGASGYREIDD